MNQFFRPPKLEDCANHGEGSELVIVEGDSAARAVNSVRAHGWQAVWPMQGKPMNALKADKEDLLENNQFGGLIRSMRVDLDTGTDQSKMRYERFLLLFDPDADGIHAQTLMLLFFYQWLRPILESGRVFGTHAPRWMITAKELDEPAFAFSDRHLERVSSHLSEAGVDTIDVKRFRGLGSVGGPVLSQYCLDPDTRRIKPLGVADAESALAVFEQLRDVGKRLAAE